LLTHLDFLEDQIGQLSANIARQIETMSAPPEDTPIHSGGSLGCKGTSLCAEDAPLLPTQAMAFWDTIPGVDQRVTEVMVAELGVDMSRFPDHRHAGAWVGFAPGNNESAGKHYSGRTTKGNPALRSVLIQAAWAASRSKGTYLSALYHRLAPRRGKKRAIVAVAHSILVAAYHMAKRREVYQDAGCNYFDQRRKDMVVSRLSRRLQKLGYSVVLTPQALAS
jgi:transposase